MNKVNTASEAISLIKDGMTIGIGGWGPRRKPMALIREILRSPVKDLTVVTYGGPDAGLLCAAGKVKELIYGFVSLDAIPLEAHWRRAREAGSFKAVELDEGMLHWGLRAAGMRLPFLPTRCGLGTDVLKHANIKLVKSPYDDQENLVAMPALNLDVALIHVTRADRLGNTQTLGADPFFDDLFARAAQATIVSCDELVERMDHSYSSDADKNLFERSLVKSVVHTPCGAHPTISAPNYGWDMAHLKEYSGFAEQDDGYQKYFEAYIASGENAYLEKNGGLEKINKLALPSF
ncbi:CoA transferase subunit A [Polynucleobacter sp. 30F-ANTBAC]|jgi:glutaconate CoA-transferase, subunit A|uniref:CoA transferase subunit A n=1 Tax=Polynucleobacter sp. 30F-ANTBAC TaxID=2689095 RepID=UPI001C0C04D1|nr:CoA-transferase [Polynucleobacter sp. 30F-ANTBAC]MBU3600414.1 CoA transferase subunit A [Polynucleobacter sp. 30F-ANTBAC]